MNIKQNKNKNKNKNKKTNKQTKKQNKNKTKTKDVKIFNNNYVLTISEDQRLNIWSINIETNGKIESKLINSKYMDIADVSCMDVKQIKLVY